jgi:hypothetical protein
MGHLLRRNVLVYKAPPNYEAYDLIAMHPDPREKGPKLRLQVKSRSASDAGQFFPMKSAGLDGFDFLVYVRLNIGYFYRTARIGQADDRPPEFYTLPASAARTSFSSNGKWGGRIAFGKADLAPYRDAAGFEQIATVLKVDRPRPPTRNGDA